MLTPVAPEILFAFVGLLFGRLHLLWSELSDFISSLSTPARVPVCRKSGLPASLGNGTSLTLPKRASQVDVTLLGRLAQKFLVNMTEKTVEIVYVKIQVEAGGFLPRGDCR